MNVLLLSNRCFVSDWAVRPPFRNFRRWGMYGCSGLLAGMSGREPCRKPGCWSRRNVTGSLNGKKYPKKLQFFRVFRIAVVRFSLFRHLCRMEELCYGLFESRYGLFNGIVGFASRGVLVSPSVEIFVINLIHRFHIQMNLWVSMNIADICTDAIESG